MLAKEARKPTNVADCHVTAFQCHPFLQRIAGLAGWVLAATALAAFANNLISFEQTGTYRACSRRTARVLPKTSVSAQK